MTAVLAKTSGFRTSLSTLKGAIHGAIARAVKSAVDATEHAAKATTLFQDRTGALRGGIAGEAFGLRGRVEVGKGDSALQRIAKFIVNGTRPHPIEARRAQVLRFVVNGTPVFRRTVRHPGTDARPFMLEAARVGERAFAYGGQYYVDYAIRQHNGR